MKVQDICGLLEGTIGFETVELFQHPAENPTHLMILGRLKGSSKRLWELSGYLHLASAKGRWTVDVSKAFVSKRTQAEPLKQVMAWRIMFDGLALDELLPIVAATIRGLPAPIEHEVTEVPLPAPPNRNAPNARGKGAAAVGKLAIGQMAVAKYGSSD